MGKWREETKILSCGCKIGKTGKGPWFLDYYCKTHVEEVRTNGRFDLEKAFKYLEKLNKMLKKNPPPDVFKEGKEE